jgi:hypothetical protein
MTGLRSYRTATGKDVADTAAAFGDRALPAIGRQIYRELHGVLGESQPLVPVDTGTLRASGYVGEPAYERDSHVSVEIGFGGPAAKINPVTGQSADSYAIFVHENLEAHHTVGQAKFLEIPLNAALDGMSGRIAAGMKADLGGAGALAAPSGGSDEMEGG